MKMEGSELKINTELWSLVGSVLVGILSLIGVIYSSKRTQSKNEALQDAKMEKIVEMNKMTFERIEEKIVNLTKAQEKHNSTIERTFNLEKQMGEANRSLKSAFNSLDEAKSEIREVRASVEKLDNQVTEIRMGEIRLEEKLNKGN